MKPAEAAAVLRNLRNEKQLAIRNAKNRKKAERAAHHAPTRPQSAIARALPILGK